jgi:DNA (cytosine-5)-methyltransferase 1
MTQLRELSLFSGGGGGLLGSLLLGWKTIGYVEYDDYCQRVIRQRITDGILPVAPIFGDVRQFLESGAAAEYRGITDVVTAGFPCQPFSVAGKRQGADDARNMWPATIACIREVRPRYAFMENVPGLFVSGYFEIILSDLAESGYDGRWCVLSAAEVGAPHKRDRLWIVAYANGQHEEAGLPPLVSQRFWWDGFVGSSHDVATSHRQTECPCCGETYCLDADEHWFGCERCVDDNEAGWSDDMAGWWQSEPGLGRVAHGIPYQLDRLTAIGNAQVPAVAATAWRLLTGDLPQ